MTKFQKSFFVCAVIGIVALIVNMQSVAQEYSKALSKSVPVWSYRNGDTSARFNMKEAFPMGGQQQEEDKHNENKQENDVFQSLVQERKFLSFTTMHFFHNTAASTSTSTLNEHHNLSAAETSAPSTPHSTANASLLFVHVGKAGGTTIQFTLRAGCNTFPYTSPKRIRCLEDLSDTQVSSKVGGLIHVHRSTMDLRKQPPEGYLVVMRHPIARSISWYHYVNPNNCENYDSYRMMRCRTARDMRHFPNSTATQFFRCFPELFDLMESFQNESNNHSANDILTDDSISANGTTAFTRTIPDNDGPSTDGTVTSIEQYNYNCHEIAKLIFRGKGVDNKPKENGSLEHMEHNLQEYARATNLKPPIYLVRTEHLWDDMKQIDKLFGGNGDFGKIDGLKETHGVVVQDSYAMTTTTSVTSGTTNTTMTKDPLLFLPDTLRRNMCCQLLGEMEWYRKVLAWAENLSPDDAISTWKMAVHYCGASSWTALQRYCYA